MKFAWTGASPKIGYRNPECIRGMHPSGLKEMLISTDKQLNESVKEVLIRIAANVGMKKRRVIEEKAKKYGLDIINPLKENSKGEKKS
jgi:large subunit ribosomal protein L32e